MSNTPQQEKRVLVVYHTVTGFSKTYGTWIHEALGGDLYSLDDLTSHIKAKAVNLRDYDLIVFGAGIRMHIIRGFKVFRRLLHDADLLGSGKVIVWANGGTPQHPDRDWKSAARTFTRNELAKDEYSYFYLEGGIKYEGLNPVEKRLLRLFSKRVQKYRHWGDWAVAVADGIAEGYDHTNRESLKPLLERARTILGRP